MKSILDLKRDWEIILNGAPAEIKKTNGFALLKSSAKPQSINNNVVLLRCAYQLHADYLLKSENRGIVERLLSNYLGEVISIDTEQGEITLTPEEEAARQEEKAIEEAKLKELQRLQAIENHKAYLKLLFYESNLDQPGLKSYTFENFEVKTAVQKRAIEAAKNFCQFNFTDEQWANYHESDDKSYTLTFHGPPGTGKTHLAVAIGLYLLSTETTVKFWPVPSLLERLRRGYDDQSYYKVYDNAKDAETLILDDWGMHKSTEWADEQLDALIDFRLRYQRQTIITTNLSFKDLQPRVRSRLSEGVTVSMTGDDYRMIKGIRKAKTGGSK